MSDRSSFNIVERQDRAEVIAATQRFLKAHASVKDATVSCDRIEAGFARISALDNKGKAEPVFGFAKRGKDGKWEVLSIGTFFDAAYFKAHAIPEKLQKV